MKTFEVEIFSCELIHYSEFYKIEAETKEEAEEKALKGEISNTDCETTDYTELTKEEAMKYATGEKPLRELHQTKEIPSKEEVEAKELERRKRELQGELILINQKLQS